MFNFQAWIDVFNTHLAQHGTAYNDAESYGVSIEIPDNRDWRVLGIHHLLPDENKGNHNVFIEMLCKQGDREGFRAIHWTWEGRNENTENAPPVFAGQKPPNELVDIPLNLGMVVSVWTNGSEIAKGFSSNHPDEGNGNTVGHHSFFVCFQEIDENEPLPPIEPPKEIEVISRVGIVVNQEYVASLEADDDGNVMILASVLGDI